LLQRHIKLVTVSAHAGLRQDKFLHRTVDVYFRGRTRCLVQNYTFQKDVSDRGRNDILSGEIGLLQLLVRGYSNKLAAQQLSLSPLTIGGHVRSIDRNFGVCSHNEAVMRAFRDGLLHS